MAPEGSERRAVFCCPRSSRAEMGAEGAFGKDCDARATLGPDPPKKSSHHMCAVGSSPETPPAFGRPGAPSVVGPSAAGVPGVVAVRALASGVVPAEGEKGLRDQDVGGFQEQIAHFALVGRMAKLWSPPSSRIRLSMVASMWGDCTGLSLPGGRDRQGHRSNGKNGANIEMRDPPCHRSHAR